MQAMWWKISIFSFTLLIMIIIIFIGNVNNLKSRTYDKKQQNIRPTISSRMMAIPNLNSCNDMDKHNNDNNNQFQLILDMGREYGFSIFGHKIDEEYSCHYSCWNGFYQNFRPIPSTSINHKICKLISKELCEHLRNVKIKLQSIRLIFLLNKTFYYFLANNKSEYMCLFFVHVLFF